MKTKSRILNLTLLVALLSTPFAFADQTSSPATDSDTGFHVYNLPNIEFKPGRLRLRNNEFNLEGNAFSDSTDTNGLGGRLKFQTFLLADELSKTHKNSYFGKGNYAGFLVVTPGVDVNFSAAHNDENNSYKLHNLDIDASALAIFQARGVTYNSDGTADATGSMTFGNIGYRYSSDRRLDNKTEALVIDMAKISGHASFLVNDVLVDICGSFNESLFVGKHKVLDRSDRKTDVAFEMAANACVGVGLGEKVGELRNDFGASITFGPGIESGRVNAPAGTKYNGDHSNSRRTNFSNTLSFREIAGSPIFVSLRTEKTSSEIDDGFKKDGKKGDKDGDFRHHYTKSSVTSNTLAVGIDF